jgi:hypothetical protein
VIRYPVPMPEPKRPRGRPVTRGSSSIGSKIEIRVTPEEREKYRAAAEAANEDLSAVARRLLDVWAKKTLSTK